MKYLNLFESFDIGYRGECVCITPMDQKYYIEISEDEADRLRFGVPVTDFIQHQGQMIPSGDTKNGSWCDLSDNEIEKILNYFPNKEKIDKQILFLKSVYKKSLCIKDKNNKPFIGWGGCNIFKLNDEWFIVEEIGRFDDERSYYKCDQMDGLKKLIDDKYVSIF